MDIRLLGTVELDRHGERVHLTGRRTRSLLALLSLNAGRVVPVERILRLVWPGETVTTAPRLLQKQVSALRGLIKDPELLRRQGTGYVLHAARAAVDAHVFEDDCAAARSALARGDVKAAAGLLREALALWRGPALAGTTDELARAFGPGLEEQLLAARCDRIAAAIDLGDAGDVLGELSELISDRPVDERLRRLRILALDRTDRRGEAIGEYHEFRRILDDELGVEPGAALQAAYTDLIAERRGRGALPPPSHRIPRQLPAAPRHFVGRTDILAALDAAVETPSASVAVVGSPGVGKTALALHWAHTRSDLFPDGQIYVNLRGYDESEPMPSAGALGLLLMAVATPESEIPADLDARAAAWRTAVAGRRMLIVLDNARDSEQLRPLLPGCPETSVLVTSRDMLAGLIAGEGATRLLLDRLTVEESIGLLGRVVGGDRLTGQRGAVEAIVQGCARLPLALRLAAERAARRPGLPLSTVAEELTDELRRFEVLDAGDPRTRVHGVIAWSLRDLPQETARLFRLLGVHPNAEPTAHFAANLTGLEPSAAARGLELLANASLVTSTGADRYGLHDLLRAFAAAAARETDDEATRRGAMDGMLTWYRHTANAAMDLLAPLRDPTPPCPPPLFPQPPFAGQGDAALWLASNLQAMITAIRLAAEHDRHEHVRDLHYPLVSFLLQRRDVDQALDVLDLAATAAARLGDVAAEADVASGMGKAHTVAYRLDKARTHHEHAARLYEKAGDSQGQAAVLRGMGIAAARAGDFDDALALFERAVAVAEAAGIHSEVARCGVNIGNVHTYLGAYDKALPLMRSGYEYFTIAEDQTAATAALACVSYCLCELGELDAAAEHATRAVDAARRLGAISLEEYGLLNLAMARSRQGRHPEAVDAITEAVAIVEATADQQRRCVIYSALGRIRQKAGDPAMAARAFREALAVAEAIGDTSAAADAAERLEGLGDEG